MINAIALFQLVLFSTYLGVVADRFGVLPSISDSYYKWRQDDKLKWLFEVVLIITGLSMWFYGLYDFYGDIITQVAIATSGYCLMMVAVAPAFKKDSVETIHSVGAVLSIVAGFVAVGFQYGLWWGVGLLGIFLLICATLRLLKITNYTWWIEIVAFYIILGRLMIMI